MQIIDRDSVLNINALPVASSLAGDCICTRLLLPIAPLNKTTVELLIN